MIKARLVDTERRCHSHTKVCSRGIAKAPATLGAASRLVGPGRFTAEDAPGGRGWRPSGQALGWCGGWCLRPAGPRARLKGSLGRVLPQVGGERVVVRGDGHQRVGGAAGDRAVLQ